jgi:hypothetical protein
MHQRGPDLVDTAVASAFGDEAAPWFERAVNGRDHRVGLVDPMQYRVAEDGIELLLERQILTAHHLRVEAESPRGFYLRST